MNITKKKVKRRNDDDIEPEHVVLIKAIELYKEKKCKN